jgi:hypothetical protein
MSVVFCVFFELSFIFCRTIINQMPSQEPKNCIFQTPVANLVDLQQRIRYKIMEMNNNPITLENVMRNFHRRVLKCIDEGG